MIRGRSGLVLMFCFSLSSLTLAAVKPSLEVGGSAFRGHNLKLFSNNRKLWSETTVERWEIHLFAGSGSGRAGFMVQGLHLGGVDIRGLWFGGELGEPLGRVWPWFRILAGPYRALRPGFEEATYGGSLGMEMGLAVKVWRELHADLSFQWLAGVDHLQVDKPRVRAFASQTPLFGVSYIF